MSLTGYLVAALVAAGAWAGSCWKAYELGRDHELATQAREDTAAERTRQVASQAAAQAIAGIEVKNTTIRQTLEREVRENTVYRDCRSGPGAVSVLNASPGIAASGPEPTGGGQLPAAGASR